MGWFTNWNACTLSKWVFFLKNTYPVSCIFLEIRDLRSKKFLGYLKDLGGMSWISRRSLLSWRSRLSRRSRRISVFLRFLEKYRILVKTVLRLKIQIAYDGSSCVLYMCTLPGSWFKGYSRLAGHSKIELWLHLKKDGFFLHNLFILGPKVQKSHVVPHQFYMVN